MDVIVLDIYVLLNVLTKLVGYRGEEIMAGIKFEIVEHIGVLSENTKGWKKELNLISWNEREPKYDIRDWNVDHEKMGKGITLSKEEIVNMKRILENHL